MTKRRVWQDPQVAAAHRAEDWGDAAARAAGECLGRTFTTAPELVAELPGWAQSDRDGIWKRYHFQVFRIAVPEAEAVPAPGVLAEWLTPEEIQDPQRRPISPSARHIIAELKKDRHV